MQPNTTSIDIEIDSQVAIAADAELSSKPADNAHYYFFSECFNGLKWKARLITERPNNKESAKVYKQGHVMIALKYESEGYFSKKDNLSDTIHCKALVHNINPDANRSIGSDSVSVAIASKAFSTAYESKSSLFTLCDVNVFDQM